MNPELDPTLLAELRELHQNERASAELERNVLARILPLRKAPLGVRVRAWWSRAPLGRTILAATLGMAAVGAIYLGSRALSTDAQRRPGPEPRLGAAGDARPAAPCPLDARPPGFAYEPTRMDPEAVRAGLQLDTFAMPIPGCPDLVRRTLTYVPRGLVRGPAFIVLHDGGSSAEGVRASHLQGSFEALAESGFTLVYANAAPTAGRLPNSGFWQTDPNAHRAIDDFAYLARIVERLGDRGLLVEPADFGPDVYLVGYGSGARLALEAAAQHPEAYSGVAAILPGAVNRSRPPPRRASTRLSRVLFVTQFVTQLDERPRAYTPRAPVDAAVLEEWKAAIGLSPLGLQRPSNRGLPNADEATLVPAIDEEALLARQVVPAGTRVFDSSFPDKGGPMVRVVVVQSQAAINVGPGGRPAPLDVARLVLEFFQRGVSIRARGAAP